MRTLLVLADRFAAAIDHPDVIGLTAFRQGRHDDCRIVTGQGAGHHERVPPALVHKHRPENVLIADLERLGEHRFRAALSIAEDNELILDHLSGSHLPGMVIKEASRQMILAVTETWHPATAPRSYVLRSWSTTFERFLFPLDATIDYTVDRIGAGRDGRLDFGVTIEIHQHGQRASRSTAEVLTYDGARLAGLERRQAGETIAAALRTPEMVSR